VNRQIFIAALTAGVLISLPQVSSAKDWAGHLATLSDARDACRDTASPECLPYLAEAVAIGDLLHDQAEVSSSAPDASAFEIVFERGEKMRCSRNWFDSLNGQTLLHAGLGLPIGIKEAESTYWSEALQRAAISLCHS
jgi:hypothetical protein